MLVESVKIFAAGRTCLAQIPICHKNPALPVDMLTEQVHHRSVLCVGTFNSQAERTDTVRIAAWKSFFEPHRISPFCWSSNNATVSCEESFCAKDTDFPFWSEGNQIPAKCLPEILLGKTQNCEKGYRGYAHLFNSNAGDRVACAQVQRSHRNCSRSFRVMLSLKSGTGFLPAAIL